MLNLSISAHDPNRTSRKAVVQPFTRRVARSTQNAKKRLISGAGCAAQSTCSATDLSSKASIRTPNVLAAPGEVNQPDVSAAVGSVSGHWVTLASLPRHRGRSKALGIVADTLDVAGLGFGHGL